MLRKDSLNLLALFTDYLLDTDTSVYEFFDGIIYNQVVRTKNKQSTVEIISAEDFIKKVRNDQNLTSKVDANFVKCEQCSSNPTVNVNSLMFCNECEKIYNNNICEFLCLDINYKHLLLVKKIIKCLEELSHNEGLRVKAGVSQLSEVAPDDK